MRSSICGSEGSSARTDVTFRSEIRTRTVKLRPLRRWPALLGPLGQYIESILETKRGLNDQASDIAGLSIDVNISREFPSLTHISTDIKYLLLSTGCLHG